mmetsp:Transcript_37980/g.66586  ORF Transcript_37980/g.66586 Transcript_37980/m.66586 type:complete len:286 (-) Transcript_37980:28-885(-)
MCILSKKMRHTLITHTLRSHAAHIHTAFKPTISTTATILPGVTLLFIPSLLLVALLFILHSSSHHWSIKSTSHAFVLVTLSTSVLPTAIVILLPHPTRVGKSSQGIISMDTIHSSSSSSSHHTAATTTHHALLAHIHTTIKTTIPTATTSILRLARPKRIPIRGIGIESITGVHPIITTATTTAGKGIGIPTTTTTSHHALLLAVHHVGSAAHATLGRARKSAIAIEAFEFGHLSLSVGVGCHVPEGILKDGGWASGGGGGRLEGHCRGGEGEDEGGYARVHVWY